MPNYHMMIQWRTIISHENSSCTIRISNGIDDESQFVTVFPRDQSADSFGKFPCGRFPNSYENKEFNLPEKLSCEKCTLQLIWEYDNITNYHCADITIMDDQIKFCMGKCKNDGACVNGKCVCLENYYGTYCEYKSNKDLVFNI